jgi:hypothetical protein
MSQTRPKNYKNIASGVTQLRRGIVRTEMLRSSLWEGECRIVWVWIWKEDGGALRLGKSEIQGTEKDIKLRTST